MGQLINNIAKETVTPARFSLSGKPNFIQFDRIEQREENEDLEQEIKINVLNCGYIFVRDLGGGKKEYKDVSKFTIKENGNQHTFEGTSNYDKQGNSKFYTGPISDIGPAWENKKENVAENLKECLLKNDYFKKNFEVSIPPEKLPGGDSKKGSVIHFKAKGQGRQYHFKLDKSDPETANSFIELEYSIGEDYFDDSILGENDSVELQLDIYKDTKVFPGKDNFSKMGKYTTTLSKTYFGEPVWFNLNSMWGNQDKYAIDFLDEEKEWSSPGTITDFRFTAKKSDGVNNETFYHSDVLYALTGYGRSLDATDMNRYVYDTAADNILSPLTTQPALTYIKGQKQYFNFILSDPFRNIRKGVEDMIGITYKLRSQSGNLIAKVEKHQIDIESLCAINTVRLDIDSLIDEYPKTGIVEVQLSRNGVVRSHPLTFHIVPECLYKVNDFAFLNSLGGWSSFSFGGVAQTEFKSQATTIYRTHTPDFNISSRIESVFNKEITEQFTVQTLPIKAEVAEWLKEISGSIAVYDLSTKRYVIIDEMNVKHNTKDELFTLQMKYHYSDGYGG